jgi:hypothetical protein
LFEPIAVLPRSVRQWEKSDRSEFGETCGTHRGWGKRGEMKERITASFKHTELAISFALVLAADLAGIDWVAAITG